MSRDQNLTRTTTLHEMVPADPQTPNQPLDKTGEFEDLLRQIVVSMSDLSVQMEVHSKNLYSVNGVPDDVIYGMKHLVDGGRDVGKNTAAAIKNMRDYAAMELPVQAHPALVISETLDAPESSWTAQDNARG